VIEIDEKMKKKEGLNRWDTHWGVAALHADAVVQVAADFEAQRVAVVHCLEKPIFRRTMEL
jgi:hypothetical protein